MGKRKGRLGMTILALGLVFLAGAWSTALADEDLGQTPWVPTEEPDAARTTIGTTTLVTRVCDLADTFLTCEGVSRSAEIVFVFDTTGSMGGQISGMKTAVLNFVSTLTSSGVTPKLGLVEYKDFPKSPCGITGDFPYKVYNGGSLTGDSALFKTWIDALKATGGNDTPESLLAALSHAVSDIKWESGQRIVIVITDAPPHSDGHTCNQEGNTLAGVINKLTGAGVVVHVIGRDDTSLKKIASDTGGRWFQISSGTTFTSLIGTIADTIKCFFDISSSVRCEGNKMTIQVKLIGKDGLLPCGIGESVNAKVCSSSGACTTVSLTPNEACLYSGTATLPAAGGTYTVGISANWCGYSASKTLRINCGCVGACADCPDSDNDGVIDVWDKCPGTPECSGVDRFGCPVCKVTEDCIRLIIPTEGQVFTTSIQLAAVTCPTPAAVRFDVCEPSVIEPSGSRCSPLYTDNNAADGWGVFDPLPLFGKNVHITPITVQAVALDGAGNVTCKSAMVSFGIDTVD